MLKRILFIAILSTYFLPQIVQAQYELPKDNRYWKYHNWYVSHSIVSLVVSGKDDSHLAESIEEIQKLKKKGVLIGEIMVIGKTDQTFDKISESLGSSTMEDADSVARKYKINYSPTWIVRYQGRDYVFEGLKSPQSLFTSEGNFRVGDF